MNVSMKEAVDIARERIKSYSYEMPGGIWIKDFSEAATGVNFVRIQESLMFYTPIGRLDCISISNTPVA